MKLYQTFAVFIVLIGTGSCTDLCSEYGQFKRCEQIIDTFEEALIKEESNIFALNQLFFPSNRYPASSFRVDYHIENSTFVGVRGWCKSVAHTIASPIMIQTLFTGLTYPYHMEVSRQSLMPSHLHLNISEHNFSEEEIDYALDYITPWLKLYTRKEAHSGDITYKDEEKGYKCDTISFSWGLTAITVTITTAAVCMSCKVLYFLLKAKSKRAEVKRAVFFSMGFVAFLVNIVDVILIAYEVYLYIREYKNIVQSEGDLSTLRHVLAKVLELGLGVFVFGIGGAISSCCSPFLPQPELHFTCSFHASKCVYFLHFANFFYFAYIVGLNVLPTFLLLFITPIEALSVLIFFVTLLSSAVMVVTIVILRSEIHTLKKRVEARNKIKLRGRICSASINFLGLISLVLLVVVFLMILASNTNNSALYLAPVILSLGSTILAILGGYFTQERLSKENTQKSDVESGTEMKAVNGNQNGEATEENPTDGTPATEENDHEHEKTPLLQNKK